MLPGQFGKQALLYKYGIGPGQVVHVVSDPEQVAQFKEHTRFHK